MTCYHPLKAYRPLSKVDGGRLVFNAMKALNPDNPVMVPCNKCIGCKIDRSRDWAMRCHHEAQMHLNNNAFITLTFSDEHLPDNYSVSLRTWQLFMYRLRKSLGSTKIRFFACGEYGDKNLRPHYHSLIFNYSFPDKIFFKKTPQGHNIYTSKSLEKIWPYGLPTIGDVTYQTAAYTARYIMKKMDGEGADAAYVRQHPLTGKFHQVAREFCVQSRNPGLGSTWFDKFSSDAFPSDFLIVDGRKHPVPKFYQKKLTEEALTKIKRRRKKDSLPRKADNTKERLAVRETVKLSAINQLKRDL